MKFPPLRQCFEDAEARTRNATASSFSDSQDSFHLPRSSEIAGIRNEMNEFCVTVLETDLIREVDQVNKLTVEIVHRSPFRVRLLCCARCQGQQTSGGDSRRAAAGRGTAAKRCVSEASARLLSLETADYIESDRGTSPAQSPKRTRRRINRDKRSPIHATNGNRSCDFTHPAFFPFPKTNQWLDPANSVF